MRKPLMGALLGALVYFVWGNISWLMLPWHASTIKHLPEEQLISDTLKTVIAEPGFYSFPSATTTEGHQDMKAWAEKYRKGPIGSLIFSPNGKEPIGFLNIIFGFIGALVIASITMAILGFSRDRVTGFVPRTLLVLLLGLLAGFSIHYPYWIWFHFPMDFTLVSMEDTAVSFLLVGMVQAVFVPKE